MLESFHIDSFSMELHALQFQACSLLMSGSAAQLDLTTCTQYTVPR